MGKSENKVSREKRLDLAKIGINKDLIERGEKKIEKKKGSWEKKSVEKKT